MLQLEWITTSRKAAAAAKTCGRILVVNGNPDPRPQRFCAALCDAYEEGARSAGCSVQRLDTGTLNLAAGIAADDGTIERAIDKIRSATQLTVIFPLWLDEPPVTLLELFARCASRLQGPASDDRTARAVITMEMPAFAHRALWRGQQVSERQERPTYLPGLNCIEETYIGGVDTISPERRETWLRDMRNYGTTGTMAARAGRQSGR